jgi:exopolysaccharide production protein ExoZ
MRYLFGLQYLRAAAALGVVGFHASENSHLNLDLGQAGVDLFFVLSGFLMWSITEAPTTPMAFFIGRIRRIVPVYWIATCVVLVGALFSLFPAITLNTPHVLSSFFFIPARSPSNGHIWPLLVPGWTLNYEMFFYLIFSLVLFLPRRIQLLVMITIFGGLVASRALAQFPVAELTFYSDPIILEFIAV